MNIRNLALLSCMAVAGCASIPANMAARQWVGRSMGEANLAFGEPLHVKTQGDGRKVGIWHLERYMDELRPVGNVIGRDAGGRPVLHPVHEKRQNRYACEVTLVSEGERIVSAKVRPIAGMGPLLAGGCAQRGL